MSENIFVTNIFEYSNIRIYSSHSGTDEQGDSRSRISTYRGIPRGHLGYILGRSWGDLGEILGISRAYQGDIWGISGVYLGNMRGISGECPTQCHKRATMKRLHSTAEKCSICTNQFQRKLQLAETLPRMWVAQLLWSPPPSPPICPPFLIWLELYCNEHYCLVL